MKQAIYNNEIHVNRSIQTLLKNKCNANNFIMRHRFPLDCTSTDLFITYAIEGVLLVPALLDNLNQKTPCLPLCINLD